jgi:hypothetical protein
MGSYQVINSAAAAIKHISIMIRSPAAAKGRFTVNRNEPDSILTGNEGVESASSANSVDI